MASASPPEGGHGAPCLAWGLMDVMELAGRLAQQHAQELKEVLRLKADRAKQARTQLQALAQALHHILGTSTSTSGDGEERGSDGAMAVEKEGGERSTEVSVRE
jgi:2-polyprenyl-6-methoxyphenol hydroxylase-like FAD-dependent oxidoreductase